MNKLVIKLVFGSFSTFLSEMVKISSTNEVIKIAPLSYENITVGNLPMTQSTPRHVVSSQPMAGGLQLTQSIVGRQEYAQAT